MTAPRRIQRRRTPGWRLPHNARIVDRTTRWGNPFTVRKNGTKWQVIDINDRFASLREQPWYSTDAWGARVFAASLYALHTGPLGLYEFSDETLAEIRRVLGGRDLACWCPLPEPGDTDHCHAAVLLRIANPDHTRTKELL